MEVVLTHTISISPFTLLTRLVVVSSFLILSTFINVPIRADDQLNENSIITISQLSNQDVRVFVDGLFFAEYRADYKGTPIVWPICGINQTLTTRAWPMIEDIDINDESDSDMKVVYQNALISERGGVKDHPHHRSLWFNHGNVLGGDFWSGTQSYIKQSQLLDARTDGKTATIETENYWFNARLNRYICRDIRNIVFGVLFVEGKIVRYIDFSVTIFALENGVIFGDTKEGSFGIRVPSPTAMSTKKLNPNWGGSILNDAGETAEKVWGKRSKWVNYTGPAERFLTGKELVTELQKGNEASDFPLTQIGIAVLSGPSSLGKLGWSHVRDYGLFACNPFGKHDFESQNSQESGEQILNKNESLTFSYRVLFHSGNLTNEDLNRIYQEYNK